MCPGLLEALAGGSHLVSSRQPPGDLKSLGSELGDRGTARSLASCSSVSRHPSAEVARGTAAACWGPQVGADSGRRRRGGQWPRGSAP